MQFWVLGTLQQAEVDALHDAGAGVHDVSPDQRHDWPALLSPKLAHCVVFECASKELIAEVLSDLGDTNVAAFYVLHKEDSPFPTRSELDDWLLSLPMRLHPALSVARWRRGDEIAPGVTGSLMEPLPTVFRKASAARDAEPQSFDPLREGSSSEWKNLPPYESLSEIVRPNDRVLELGCASGYGLHLMRQRKPDARYWGAPDSLQDVTYARAHYAANNLEFFAPDAQDWQAPLGQGAAFDLVLLPQALDGADDSIAQRCSAVNTVLSPGGRVALNCRLSVLGGAATPTEEASQKEHLLAWISAKWGNDYVLDRVCTRTEPSDDALWVILMKLPLWGAQARYVETVHRRFDGKTHLIDFAEHYANPWLVHALVEIPFRLRDKAQLARCAESVLTSAPAHCADFGAALAIAAYRALEQGSAQAVFQRLWSLIRDYLDLRTDNPHVLRWQISLRYVRARMYLRCGEQDAARADFTTVSQLRVADITPTLGTKTLDAAFRAGTLAWLDAEHDEARELWRSGIAQAGELLGGDWLEFIGNTEAPLGFSMNDAVEIVDRATACAHALSASYAPGGLHAVQLYAINQQCLRTALSERETDLQQAAAESKVRQLDVDRLAIELIRMREAYCDVENTAIMRMRLIVDLQHQLDKSEKALAEAQCMAYQRLDFLCELNLQLEKTQSALNEAEKLAIERLEALVELKNIRKEDENRLASIFINLSASLDANAAVVAALKKDLRKYKKLATRDFNVLGENYGSAEMKNDIGPVDPVGMGG